MAESENERWKRVMTAPIEPASREFSEADYEAAASRLLVNLFDRLAWTSAEESKWQNDISEALVRAKFESDPRMRKAMIEHLEVCQYSLDSTKRINADLLAHEDEFKQFEREWRETEMRASELLRIRKTAL